MAVTPPSAVELEIVLVLGRGHSHHLLLLFEPLLLLQDFKAVVVAIMKTI